MSHLFTNLAKVIFILIFSLNLGAKQIEEGRDYLVLKEPFLDANSTMIEIFSYDCPFCYRYDQNITSTIMSAFLDMRYEPIHLQDKPLYGKAASRLLAVMLMLDRDDDINLFSDESKFKRAKMKLYNAYHNRSFSAKEVESAEAIFRNILQELGVELDEYEKLKNDEKVLAILDSWNNERVYEAVKLQGIPAFIVDGKYLIKTAAVGGIDDMIELIKELIELSKRVVGEHNFLNLNKSKEFK
ncbi:DsbA family protein [uncultured Campylobacter sp.]|uniref:DsbA family protein n=1 Tax=uncultured Campylobacter sp. TaxID=218934 RepID=UPI002613FE53|nr:DsbA family protein [uncultured Campylobacter sp.]